MRATALRLRCCVGPARQGGLVLAATRTAVEATLRRGWAHGVAPSKSATSVSSAEVRDDALEGALTADQCHRHPDPGGGVEAGVVEAAAARRPVLVAEQDRLPDPVRQAEGGPAGAVEARLVVRHASEPLEDNSSPHVRAGVPRQSPEESLAVRGPRLGLVVEPWRDRHEGEQAAVARRSLRPLWPRRVPDRTCVVTSYGLVRHPRPRRPRRSPSAARVPALVAQVPQDLVDRRPARGSARSRTSRRDAGTPVGPPPTRVVVARGANPTRRIGRRGYLQRSLCLRSIVVDRGSPTSVSKTASRNRSQLRDALRRQYVGSGAEDLTELDGCESKLLELQAEVARLRAWLRSLR